MCKYRCYDCNESVSEAEHEAVMKLEDLMETEARTAWGDEHVHMDGPADHFDANGFGVICMKCFKEFYSSWLQKKEEREARVIVETQMQLQVNEVVNDSWRCKSNNCYAGCDSHPCLIEAAIIKERKAIAK